MNPFDRPSSDASGAAAIRQPERPNSDEERGESSANEREARIAELRKQYESGNYRIDAAELSSKIVDLHLKR